MLECYNLETCTFFTPIREMGFALHEIYEVSGLAMGDILNEEYVSSVEELHVIEGSAPGVRENSGQNEGHSRDCSSNDLSLNPVQSVWD